MKLFDEKRDSPPSFKRLLLFCVLTTTVLFLLYELFDRFFTGNGETIDTKVIYSLRLLRQLSIATTATAVITTLLLVYLNQPSSFFLKKNLKRVDLKIKIMLPMVISTVLPVATIGIFAISQIQESLLEKEIQKILFETRSRTRPLEEFLRNTQKDLLFLSQTNSLKNFVTKQDPLSIESIEQEFKIFCQADRTHYNISYLDKYGTKVVSFNSALQNDPKTNNLSKLLEQTLNLETGQIYVSNLEVFNSTIKYSTPINESNSRGVLLIEVPQDYLLSLLYPLPPETEAWLVDERGYYVGYIGTSNDKRQMYKSDRHLSADFTDSEIRKLLKSSINNPNFSQVLKLSNTYITTAEIEYGQGSFDRRFIFMLSYPEQQITTPFKNLTLFLSSMMLILILVIIATTAAIGLFVAKYLTHPVKSLQIATHEIAVGNLQKMVEVETGDEIEELARDFNSMTQKLLASNQQLANWNAKLEEEVAKQTEHLRQLQLGLARADKLTSIGQMTAGIMHEIGNPLAAIKTKIQVAEDDPVYNLESRQLMSELLFEVDRLALFLRSFSRLSRIDISEKSLISLIEVVESVASLLSSELKRRCLNLLVETVGETPKVYADANKLRQVFINLILNAAEASA
ncbi:MAG: HAMP domain-containing protein, partial [Blastocatellia bacterium]|nr:HAMP domain-containing protein [Blastocatellia bacterium]